MPYFKPTYSGSVIGGIENMANFEPLMINENKEAR